jgi:hypothetical protein
MKLVNNLNIPLRHTKLNQKFIIFLRTASLEIKFGKLHRIQMLLRSEPSTETFIDTVNIEYGGSMVFRNVGILPPRL